MTRFLNVLRRRGHATFENENTKGILQSAIEIFVEIIYARPVCMAGEVDVNSPRNLLCSFVFISV